MRNFTFLAFILLLLTSCFEKDDLVTNTPITENPQSPIDISGKFGAGINRTFLGKVMDKNHDPIVGANIQIGNTSVTTDTNGVFFIENANVNQRFAYIKASKTGFLNGSRALSPTEGTNVVEIILLENSPIASINSGEEAIVSLPNGTQVKFAGAYIDETGNTYSGRVDVVLHHLDSSDNNMRSEMPGMLYGGNSNNEEVALQSYGMVAVELHGQNGEKLNLAENSTAEIKVPLDTSLLSSAPATIPLWYFDEVAGYWKEEGSATLEGNEYVGEVSHFSFWNYDAQFPAVNLCITLLQEDGTPLANQYVKLTHFNDNYLYPTSAGITNDEGEVCGLVPANEQLRFDIISWYYCSTQNSIVYTENIGPFADDSSITITANSPEAVNNIVNFSGTLLTCDGGSVENGYLEITYQDYNSLIPLENGEIDFSLIICELPQEIQVTGYDLDNVQSTETLNYTINSNSLNLGGLISCDTVDEYITYQIDSDPQVTSVLINARFQESNPSTGLPTLDISSLDNSSTECFYLSGRLNPSPYVGTYSYANNYADIGFSFGECPVYVPDMSTSTIAFNLTSIGGVGEYIDINFNGGFVDYQGNSRTIRGSIHAIRDN